MRIANECVVLCAGRGERLIPPVPKVLTEVAGKPLFARVVEYWRGHVERFVFVVGYEGKKVMDAVKRLDVDYRFVRQDRPKGIAHAILLAQKKVTGNFIVALGDCIQGGSYIWPDSRGFAVWVWKNADAEAVRGSYSVEVVAGLVRRVVEKPQNAPNDLCGMGTYYFTPRIFEYIRRTPPSARRNEVEITDAIQLAIDSGECVEPIYFYGKYLNVTHPGDIKKAEELLGYV